MPLPDHDLEKLTQYLLDRPKELDWVEFKVGTFSPETVGKYASGLCNAAMYENEPFAYLVWGIDDSTREIVGTTVSIASEMVGNDEFLFWLNRQLRPQINVTHRRLQIEDKVIELLCFEPSYREPILFKGDAFVRIGNALQPLNANPERARAIWTNASRFCFEDTIILRHENEASVYEKFDIPSLVQGLRGREGNQQSQLDFLLRRGLIIDNNQGGLDVTALLALSCAKDLNSHASTIRKGVRVIAYIGDTKLDAQSDVHGKLGYATSFEALMDYILDRLPRSEEIGSGLRDTIFAIPEVAIREFVANAIIHQDIVEVGDGPLVEIFTNRIVVTNPGEPLVEPDRFIDSPSKSRNVKFGKLMRDLGLCEERGSGVDRALTAIEKAVLPPPLFQAFGGSTVVTIFMSRPFNEMTSEERVRACFQHACLRAEANDPMSNASLRERFGLPQRQYPQVSVVIKEAIEAGRIKPRDADQSNRQARYVPYYY